MRNTKEVNDKLLLKRHIVYYDILKVLNYEEYKDMNSNELAIYCKNIIDNFIKGEKVQ